MLVVITSNSSSGLPRVRILSAAEWDLNIPETVAGRRRKQFRWLVNHSLLLMSGFASHSHRKKKISLHGCMNTDDTNFMVYMSAWIISTVLVCFKFAVVVAFAVVGMAALRAYNPFNHIATNPLIIHVLIFSYL